MLSSRSTCGLALRLFILWQVGLAWWLYGQESRRGPAASPVGTAPQKVDPEADHGADHPKEREKWFLHGRTIPGKSPAQLRRRAYQAKMQARTARAQAQKSFHSGRSAQPTAASALWTPLGPVPLASDATGDGFQNYNQVSGRATAVAIDPADSTGNTLYIGGAQGGVWKSTNAANSIANNVAWTPLTDDQATLSVGAIAIQPGNTNPSQSVILAGSGEADSSADSYFGLGMLRSADGGNSWTLLPTASNGTLSFSGLGGTSIAFSTAQPNLVVAAMGATAEGVVEGALTSNTYRGLYTSTDAGQTWIYDAILSGNASESTSATSVVYNAAAGLFFAALRYHGFYSSPDGLNWTELPNQPGQPGLLGSANCPQNYATTCPFYRAEISVVPGRNEVYVWFISLDANDDPVDQGIWQTLNAGATWTQILDSGIIECGDIAGCGVDQGFYNLALLALPNGQATDLYAGAINIYKCSISVVNPTCANTPFLNLTHAYGCDPLAAPAHVHPDQHAFAYTLTGSTDLMYFANDGGIYRALDGFSGLTTGSCSGTNLFDDLNQNLGSMTQFVSFSQHSTNENMVLGGTQDNGSPASVTASTSLSWGNVLSGDGGYNAIDANTGNWYASTPDTGGGSLAIQQCSSGMSCNDSLFSVVVDSNDVGGDDGAFYFPYILDPQSTSSLLVGTCRVWSGPRSGGTFTELSLNFDTLGLGTCSGNEINVVRSVAAGGPANANGSQVVYATTDGPGPNNLSTPIGGNVWVTANATAVSGTASTFANTTLNGPGGNSINANQFPISSVAIDPSDPTGNTAYVTLMGFTGGPGHVWQTTDAGASWSDFSGAASSQIPDSPANAVVVDPAAHMVYVGTDVGVFQSSTSSAAWTEVGPIPSTSGGVTGFLPDVAVTALAIFNSGGQKLLRASTYGRGVWQYNLLATPNFQITFSNNPLTIYIPGQPAVFQGTLTAINGYNNNVELSCTGNSSPTLPCSVSVDTLTPTPTGSAFNVTVNTSTTIADYSFNVQGLGLDPAGTTNTAPITLDIVSWSISAPTPNPVNEPRGSTSPPVTFTLSAQGSFNQTVTLSCSSFTPNVPGATCAFTPSAPFKLTSSSPMNATVNVTVPASTTTGPYGASIVATTVSGANTKNTFTANVVLNPTFTLSAGLVPNIKAGGASQTAALSITPQDGFAAAVTLTCLTTLANTCSVSPSSVTSPYAPATLTISSGTLAGGGYQVSVQGTSGAITSSVPIPFIVEDYDITGPSTLTAVPGSSATANLTFTSEESYVGTIDLTCDASALAGAQCTLAPASPIAIGSGAHLAVATNLTVPGSAAFGTYNINLNTHDASGEPAHTFIIPLTVQDFALASVTPATQSIGSGQSATYNLNVAPLGSSFSGAVSLSCTVSAPHSTCTPTPGTIPANGVPASVRVAVAITAATAQATYSVVITGTSGPLSHSVSVPLIVANTLQLALTTPFPALVDAGTQQIPATVTLTPNYSGTVNAKCSVPQLSGAQCNITPSNPIGISGAPVKMGVLVNTLSNSLPGTYSVNISVTDSSGSPTQTLTPLPAFTVAQDYAINVSNPALATQTITAGQSITYNLSVVPVGASYSNPVNLSCSAPLLPGNCSVAPGTVSLLSGAAAAVLTVNTNAPSTQSYPPRLKGSPWMYAVFMIFLTILPANRGAPLPFQLNCTQRSKSWRSKSARSKSWAVALALLLLLSLNSCSSSGANRGSTTTTGTPITYTITVSGSPASLSQPNGESVMLIVQ
jgi:hypothetical protein